MITLGDFVPPVVRKIARRLRRPPAPPVEQRVFPDYESAVLHCGGGWDDDHLARRVVDDAARMRANTLLVPPRIPVLELRPLAAIAWMLAERPRPELTGQELTVVDFGGSAGHNYFAAKALFPALRFRWVVVETAAMAKAASLFANDELSFVTGVASVPAPDLVFSSGAVQYHPRPLDLMRQLLALRAPFIALFRTAMAGGGESFSAVQRASLAVLLRETPVAPEEDVDLLYPVTFAPRGAYRDAFAGNYQIAAELDEGVMYRVGGATVHGYGILARRVR
jgi:putative methyltransferase (TIGR04325 family)